MLFTQLLADHQVSKFPPRELRWILRSTQQEQNFDAADIDQHDAEMTDVEFRFTQQDRTADLDIAEKTCPDEDDTRLDGQQSSG